MALLKENKHSELKSLTLLKKSQLEIQNMEQRKNEEFYENCTQYFEALRKEGKTDYEFEDEYYFTMPAISNY